MTRRKSVESTVYLTPEDSATFAEYAQQFGISKSELMVRSTYFCLGNTDQSGAFIAPQFTVDKIVERMSALAIRQAKAEGLLVVKDGYVEFK